MELKEAKNILEERKFLLINSSMPDVSLVTAIDTALEELNNRNKRIHKLEKNIEFIINKIVNKAKVYQYHTEITTGTNIETNIRQQTLTELLEEIEKEI